MSFPVFRSRHVFIQVQCKPSILVHDAQCMQMFKHNVNVSLVLINFPQLGNAQLERKTKGLEGSTSIKLLDTHNSTMHVELVSMAIY